MAHQNVALDSLPYYDKDLDQLPHLRPQINSLIAVELRSLLPKTATATPTNLSHLSAAPTTTSPFLLAELKRLESKKQIPANVGLDSTRYTLPAPTNPATASVDEWEAAHNNSLAQIEHARLRVLNTSLLSSLGANAWRIQNFTLETTVKSIEAEAEITKKEVEDLNRDRKKMQERGGEVLSRLEKKWTELISTNMQLEIGVLALEGDVIQLRQKEEELRNRISQSA